MGARRYWAYFALESVAALAILWRGVPLYREFLLDEHWTGGELQFVGFSWTCLVVIHVSHWRGLKHFRHVRVPKMNFVGQAILFLGRLNFGFVSGVFSAIFYVKYAEIEIDAIRILSIVGTLFTMFCYSLDLERIGRLFIDEYIAAQAESESRFQ